MNIDYVPDWADGGSPNADVVPALHTVQPRQQPAKAKKRTDSDSALVAEPKKGAVQLCKHF